MTTTKTTAQEAWEILDKAVRAHDECPDWETCPMAKLNRAEKRQVEAMQRLRDVGAFLGILQ